MIMTNVIITIIGTDTNHNSKRDIFASLVEISTCVCANCFVLFLFSLPSYS